MNAPENVTLLDDEAREAEKIAPNAVQQGWTSRAGRFGVKFYANAKSETLFQTTTFFCYGTVVVSPKLRDAILGLHRDDPLRRAYLRRWWMEPLNLHASAGGGRAAKSTAERMMTDHSDRPGTGYGSAPVQRSHVSK